MRRQFLSFAVAVATFGGTIMLTSTLIAQAPAAGGGQRGGGGGTPGGAPAGGGAAGAQGGGGRGGGGAAAGAARGGAGGGAAAVPAGPPARLANGKPDMNGAWSVRGGLANISTGIAEVGGVAVADAAGRVIPYTPIYKQLRAESPTRMYEEPELHCYQSGVPSHMWRQSYNGAGLVIQQTEDHIVFMTEFMGSYRIVPLNNRPHIPENIKLFMGDGVGHWEGDTLVVETTNNNAVTWLDNDGDRHSDALKVVEKFTLTSANAGTWEATFTDPKAYAAPWKITAAMAKSNNAAAEIMEFACVEGNQDNLVYTEAVGGRAKEAPIAAPAEFIAPAGARGGGGGRGGGGAGTAPGGAVPGGAAPGGAGGGRGGAGAGGGRGGQQQ